MIFRLRGRTAGLLLPMLAFLVQAPARAQESPAADPSSAPAAEEPVLSFRVEGAAPAAEASAGTPANFTAEIGADAISKAAPVSLAQVLEWAPGVQVLRYGSAAEGAYVSIRGSSPEQVLVLLNGKRLNSAQGGGVDLSGIDPNTVERIEVLRGGASALYGENALGGVVNIVTKQAGSAGTKATAQLQYGSWETVKAGASVEGGTSGGLADGYLSVSGFSSGGAYGYEGADGSGDSTTRKNADAKAADLYGALNLYPTDLLTVRGSLSGRVDEKGVPGIPQFPTESARMADRLAAGLLGATWEGASTTVDGGLAATFHQRRYRDPDYALGAQDDTHTNVAVQADASISRRVSLPWTTGARGASGPDADRPSGLAAAGLAAVALSYRADALSSTALESSGSSDDGRGELLRHQGSAALRAELPLPAAGRLGLYPVLYPSARFDASATEPGPGAAADAGSADFVSAFTWQLGAALPGRVLTAKANVGTSYRAPSFDDLFWPSTAFAAGNPDLKSERAFSWDAGVEYEPALWAAFELVYFDRTVSDLIVWTPGAGGQWRPSNIDSARIRGIEFQGRLSAPLRALGAAATLQGTASWLDPRNATDGSVNEGKLLPGKAPLAASAFLEIARKSGTFARAECSYTSYRYVTAQNTKFLDPALVFNLGAGAPLGERWKIVGRVENLLDAVYYDLRDYPVPGREFSVKVTYEYEKK